MAGAGMRVLALAGLIGWTGVAWSLEGERPVRPEQEASELQSPGESASDSASSYLIGGLVGRQVRVKLATGPSKGICGQLVRVDADGLVIEYRERRERFAWNALARLDLAVGQKSGAATGLKYGAGVGLSLALLLVPVAAREDSWFSGTEAATYLGSGLGIGVAGLGGAAGSVTNGGVVWAEVPSVPLMRAFSNDSAEGAEAGRFPEGLLGQKVRLRVAGASGSARQIEGVLLDRSAATLWVTRDGSVEEVAVESVRDASVLASDGSVRRSSLLVGLVAGGTLLAVALGDDRGAFPSSVFGVVGFGLGSGIAELVTPAWKNVPRPNVRVAPQIVRRGVGVQVAIAS